MRWYNEPVSTYLKRQMLLAASHKEWICVSVHFSLLFWVEMGPNHAVSRLGCLKRFRR